VEGGLIGEPFYLEAFVGGFFHPCDYWHSHAPISGGALYDWGAHYVDSILQLFGGPLASVRSVAHKRVWHDVTNADQERVQLLFADGREAEFLYSEVAAIRKPKWYLLGSEGALVAEWSELTLLQPHRTAFYSAQEVPVTEAPPQITLRRRTPAGDFVGQALPTPASQPYPFHHNLADHLLSGEPLAVQPQQSARVVQVLEAAARSARRGGAPEAIDG
jgi:predicted dehydrogenase